MRAARQPNARRSLIACATLAAVLGPPRAVQANGRFPAPTSMVPAPACTSNDLWGTTTFGFLVSHDAGATWHWLCESEAGVGGPYDPIVRIAPDGTIYSSTFMGLAVSKDKGCDFAHTSGSLAGAWISDVELDPTTPGTIWATTQSSTGTNGVFRSSDGGTTWAALHTSASEYFTSLRFAPSDPKRIYVSSTAVVSSGTCTSYAAHVTVSSDGGATWTVYPVSFHDLPYLTILAVNPANPDEAYMRTENGALVGDGGELYDVLRTTDAGQTWQPVLSLDSKATGIATSEDGKTLYVATSDTGLRVSSDDGTTWSPPASGPHLMCLTEHCGHLYACGDNWKDRWVYGRSDDGGKTWTGLLRFVDMCGPDPTCSASSGAQAMCGPMWPPVASMFGATCGAPATDAGPPTPKTSAAHGCCSVVGTGRAGSGEPIGGALLGLLALGGVVLWRRRPWKRRDT